MGVKPSTGEKTPGESTGEKPDASTGDKGKGEETPPKPDEGNTGEKTPNDSLDESSWDDRTKAYIKKLRKENASSRTRLNALETQFTDMKSGLTRLAGGEGEERSPEETIAGLEEGMTQTAFQNGVLQLAIEHNIGKDQVDYFSFLVAQSVEALEEGEELDDEAIGGLVEKVRKVSGGTPAKTSVTEGDEGGSKSPNDPGVTLDQFVGMSVAEKSKLYNEKPDLYSTLLKQAKKENRLIK